MVFFFSSCQKAKCICPAHRRLRKPHERETQAGSSSRYPHNTITSDNHHLKSCSLLPLTKPGNIMEPFSTSCKSLEVIQNPRGVVSQPRIGPGIRCLPLKQRRHLELFCGYCVRTWREEKYCFRQYSINSPQLPNPLGFTVKLACTLNFIISLHGIYLLNASLAVCWHRGYASGGLAAWESTLPQWGEGLAWNGKEERKEKRGRKLLVMTKFSNVFSLILLTLKY